MSRLEERLRDAYRGAADTVRQETVREIRICCITISNQRPTGGGCAGRYGSPSS